MLAVRLLGELEILHDGVPQALPPSKKTRALLAYLVASGRAHRRERLCDLFWEIPDDPRGALRWSLSRLRGLVDGPEAKRIVASRESVAFEPAGATIDLTAVQSALAGPAADWPTAAMEEAASTFRGAFLEGLDLPNLPDFQSWLLAERENLRLVQAGLLWALAERHAGAPDRALPFARQLTQIDPFNEAGRVRLLELLVALGRRGEAESQFETARRQMRELGPGSENGLVAAWRGLMRQPVAPASARPPGAAAGPPPEPAPGLALPAAAGGGAPAAPLVGRDAEQARLGELLAAVRLRSRVQVAVILAEPGLGKTRLAEMALERARSSGFRCFRGGAQEMDRERPYHPWIEALGDLPSNWRPEPEADEPAGKDAAREALFAAAASRIFGTGAERPLALVVLEDVHWLDEASAHLLGYLVRAARERPLAIVLTAREGELPDNPAAVDLLRSFRHDHLSEDIELAPLSPEDAERLARATVADIDAARVAVASGGNPLFAIELARIGGGDAELPRSVSALIRDRIDRLPAEAADILRWASVLGPTLSLERLRTVSAADADRLVRWLELLDRHGLLRGATEAGGDLLLFPHDLVHRAVYAGLSEPRRRLMHRRVAEALLAESGATDRHVAQIAHHASLAGDAGMAASACVAAGRACIRTFADAEAEALARRGLAYARDLPEPERVERSLEFLQISVMAGARGALLPLVEQLEALSERALDLGALEHARLGFQTLSFIRWESGLWAGAQRDALRAEAVSRAGDDRLRVTGMAEAARCLAMLERDLPQAEELLREAHALAGRIAVAPSALLDAEGLLAAHRGAAEQAASCFRRAAAAARRAGERISEFLALEHLALLEHERSRFAQTEVLGEELTRLAERIREGSEAAFARALTAVCRLAMGADATAELEAGLAGLRAADAKHRLALAQLAAADLDLEQGDLERARTRAAEALDLATTLQRPTEAVLAHAILMVVADIEGDPDTIASHEAGLVALLGRPLSARARRRAESLVGASGPPSSGAALAPSVTALAGLSERKH